MRAPFAEVDHLPARRVAEHRSVVAEDAAVRIAYREPAEAWRGSAVETPIRENRIVFWRPMFGARLAPATGIASSEAARPRSAGPIPRS